VLSLDGYLGCLTPAFEKEQQFLARTQSVSNPNLDSSLLLNRTQPNNRQMIRGGKSLKITNPEDRKIMSGEVLNQIINYNNGTTHQFFISGGNVTNNIIQTVNP
jgi:hypothetical protein